MDLRESRVSSTCRQHRTQTSTYPAWRYAADRPPSPDQACQHATSPNGQFFPERESRHWRIEPLNDYPVGSLQTTVNHIQAPSPWAHAQNNNPDAASSHHSRLVPPSPELQAELTRDSSRPTNGDLPKHTSPSDDGQTASTRSSYPGQGDHVSTVVGAVHDICLESTKTYLDTHRINRRARAGRSSMSYADSFQRWASRGGNDEPDTTDNGVDDRLCTVPTSSDSLLSNISRICTMLWVGSQRDRLDVLDVERLAVDNMARLLSWAETVVLGEYDEWEASSEATAWRVFEAGRNLCALLGVTDGVHAMDSLRDEITGSEPWRVPTPVPRSSW
ncbi:hypothetical protein GGS23DRAFT_403421 [Durotheca rogersii]|uniref:uncharacterized protein n=1 Tax=Durotheca rogersii TaxID=419775 RepID=UPI002220869B|nr:uncharacterized protein GGS23DRAFT_403421 [Durotheca rogersii]KAI5864993.1 hypothetical protein GGS23DRAFT_403421 [Durotheca rogersii]